MSCERLRPALSDAALGLPAASELEQHLGECPRCRAELERQRSLLARIDAGILAGMDVAAAPTFVARARLQARQRRSAPWRLHAWLLPLAAGIGFVALGLPRLWRPDKPPPPQVTSVAEQPRPSAQTTPEPAPAPPKAAQPEPSQFAAAPPRPASPPPREPEVLLRPGEAAFLRRYAESARQQPVRAAALLQAGFDAGREEAAPLRASPIQPIEQPRGTIPALEQPRVAIQPLALSREEIRPLSIPPAEPRPGPGDQPPDERQ